MAKKFPDPVSFSTRSNSQDYDIKPKENHEIAYDNGFGGEGGVNFRNGEYGDPNVSGVFTAQQT